MSPIRAITTLTIILVTLTGCARTVVENPQSTNYPPDDLNARLDFWHNLDSRSAITNDEAMHAVIILADDTDPTTTYQERVAELQRRGWLRQDFDEPPDLAVQRGTLSSMIANAIDAPQGVMSMLLDRSPRYALGDLMAIGIMPSGSALQAIDGREFLGVIAKAQDYKVMQEAHQAAKQNPLPDEPPANTPG